MKVDWCKWRFRNRRRCSLPGWQAAIAPIANAHGEGRAVFDGDQHQREAIVAMRYVDSQRRATDAYPYNPNGSPEGICALTTVDGRFTIVMPHPERVFRTVQMSWQPPQLGEDSPWMRIFRMRGGGSARRRLRSR